MNPGRSLTLVFGGVLAAIMQQSVAPRIGSPDFLLVFLTVSSMFQTRLGGALTGGYLGLLQGALATANMTHYVASRAITGFGLGWSNQFRLRPTAVLAAVIAVVGTLIAQTIWMFIAGPSGIGAFVGDTIRTAMYNGVLAMPVYVILKKVLGSTQHER